MATTPILRQHIFSRFTRWRKLYMSRQVFAFILAAFLGVGCGVAAVVLKWLVARVSIFVTSCTHPGDINWEFLLLPLGGLVLTGVVAHFVFGYLPAHGTAHIIEDLDSHRYRLRPSLMISSILLSTLTLGFGGSAGSEGPIAYTGAALGSNLGGYFRVKPNIMRVLVGIGAGAGIAGIFKSPLGGAFFTLEVLKMDLSLPGLMSLMVAVIAASQTAYALSGFTTDITFVSAKPFDEHDLLWVVALGVFCGLYSIFYSGVNKGLGDWLEARSRVWVKTLAGGVLLSVCVFLAPSLYGEGYGAIQHVINGEYDALLVDSVFRGHTGAGILLLMTGVTLALKCFATCCTNNGGGVSGEFAPTLFAGCVAGLFFAMVANRLFGAEVNEAHFALLGMAGVMAGAIRAPLMALFLVCEMANVFTFFLPMTLCVLFSFGMVRLFTFDRYFVDNRDKFNGVLSFWMKKRGKAGKK